MSDELRRELRRRLVAALLGEQRVAADVRDQERADRSVVCTAATNVAGAFGGQSPRDYPLTTADRGTERGERRTRLPRSELMDAAAWTAIGLLAATSLGTLFYLGSRIDALALGWTRFDRVDTRFDRQDARFDAIEARIDGLNSRLDIHLDRHAG